MLQKQPHLFYFIVLITISLFASRANGQPTYTNLNHDRAFSTHVHPRNIQVEQTNAALLGNRNTHQCGFAGNNDIYGIGIRIGIYSQTFAVWFAKYFIVSQAPFLRDSITVFTVALFIVSIIYVVHASTTYAVEAFILLQVLAWSCLTGVRGQTDYAKENFRNSVARRIFTESMNIGCLSLHVWFWFHGLDQMAKTPCGTFAFFVVKVDMFGWFRTLMKVFPILGLANHIYQTSIGVVGMWSYYMFQKSKRGFVETANRYEKLERMKVEKLSIHSVPIKDCHQVLADSGDSGHESEIDETRVRRSQSIHDAVEPPPRSIHQDSEAAISPEYSRFPNQAEGNMAPLPVEDWSVFQDVYYGELYLSRCVAAATSHCLDKRQACFYKLLMRLVLIPHATEDITAAFRPEREIPLNLPSYLRCDVSILKALLTFRFPSRAMTLYTHLVEAFILNPWNGPYQVYAALAYPDILPAGTHAPIPSSSSTAIASSIMLSAIRKRSKKFLKSWTPMGIDFVIHVAVILQLELTIRWNKIVGLLGIFSVGQLIPFIIGVGSLGLVLVRWVEWWHRRWTGNSVSLEKSFDSEDTDQRDEYRKFDPEVLAAYWKWKEIFEASLKEKELRAKDLHSAA